MFKIFRIRSLYLRLVRGLQIFFILLGYFWVNWMSSGRFTRRFFIPKRYRKNGAIISTHERLRAVIERLGPTFIKFGQILADRPDFISEKLRIELKKLQSEVEPFGNDVAIDLIEKELGEPIGNRFDFIDPTPIGSASIGQVYKARLKTGADVVVKIQRPHIKEKIELDLQLLKFLAEQLVKEYPEFVVMDITGFVQEFGDTLIYELNYFNEAGNAARFAEMFRDTPYCRIPIVYTEISTDKLLVLEYMDGEKPDNVPHLISLGLDPKEIASNGINVFLKMIFEHGFFHADPHAGNMFIQKNNRIALIDFGMVGVLKPSHMQFLASFTMGIATSNAETISRALLKLCDKKLFKEKEDLEFLLQDLLNRYSWLPYEKVKYSVVLEECVKIMVKFHLKIPGSIYLLVKAIAAIEKLGFALNKDMSLPAHIKPYATALIKKQFTVKAIAGDVYDAVKDYVNLIRSFPVEMSEIMYNLKQGKLIHDIKLSNEEAFVRSVKHLGRSVSIVFIIGFMFAGSAFMISKGFTPWMVNLMFGVSSALALWLLLRIFFKLRI